MAAASGVTRSDGVPVPAAALLEAMSEAVYVVDRARTITYWNLAAEQLTGFSAQEVLGHRCREGILNHVDDAGRPVCGAACPLLETMRDGITRNTQLFAHHRDGHRVPVAVSAAAVRDTNGRIVGAVEVFHDDSPRRDLADRLARAEATALVDPLTGIGNRTLAQRALHRHQSDLRRYHDPYAVFFLDIDHFKTVNDTYGHDIGDQLLRLVASTITACIRPGDTVARWGGEEFLVVARVLDGHSATAYADRLRALLSTAWVDVDTERVSITVSVGASLAEPDDTTTSLVKRADEAMYQAKQGGRNRTVTASTATA